ncbi:MAG: helix-turn-helix domain-containing protein [Candidatus Bathyarchaeota archaeon]|nr:helix-turn-helix domain-containing protein [Candidatus Bathyarchaeota archaeon]
MDPQCEVIGKYVLPLYRSMLAKELVQKYHLSQTDAAKKLGTTQAAISQYLSSKRAYKGVDQVQEFMPKLQAMAENTAQKLVSKEISAEDITVNFCGLCSTFCRHAENDGAPKPDYYI